MRNKKTRRLGDCMTELNEAVNAKRNKYAAVERDGDRFMAAAASVYGSLHPEFLSLLRTIAETNTGDRVPASLRWPYERILGAVSAAIARGNNAVMQGALQLTKAGGPSRTRLVEHGRFRKYTAKEKATWPAQRQRTAAASEAAGGGDIAAFIGALTRRKVARAATAESERKEREANDADREEKDDESDEKAPRAGDGNGSEDGVEAKTPATSPPPQPKKAVRPSPKPTSVISRTAKAKATAAAAATSSTGKATRPAAEDEDASMTTRASTPAGTAARRARGRSATRTSKRRARESSPSPPAATQRARVRNVPLRNAAMVSRVTLSEWQSAGGDNDDDDAAQTEERESDRASAGGGSDDASEQ
jgi:hypothetical protein